MAEKTLQKVEAELICSICLGTYTNPKLLQCFHVYCQGCLARLVFQDQQGQLVLSCPECRHVTPVPAGGEAGLQSAFHINHLLGIMEEHKKGRDEPTQREDRSSSNCATHDKCLEHNEELKLYCETCGKLICFNCAIKGGEHHDHQYEQMDIAFEKYKNAIKVSLKPVETQMASVKKALDQLDASHEKITDQQATIEVSIHSSIRRLQEILEVRKTQLIGQLHRIIQGKLKSLAAQKDQLETTLAQLGSCHDFMKRSMGSDNHRDVLKMKTRVVNQVTELTAPIQPDLLKPCTEADLLYLQSADAIADCQNYGQLFGPSFPDPSQCYATGKGLFEAILEEKATATFCAVDYKHEGCVEPVFSLECELISELSGRRVLDRVERIEQSKYEISYQPTIKGRHSLHIKVEGQHIKGSPFCVAVESFIEHIGDPIGSIKGVDGPWGVALTDKHELIVSGHYDHCLHVFKPDGRKLRSYGLHGSGQGQFNSPAGVAVDKDGNILVVDSGNHRVQKFTADGQFLTAVGRKGTKNLEFDRPYGIAVNSSSKVYVADSFNHRVQILTSDLNFSSSFGSRGSCEGKFLVPTDIACDSAWEVVYVTDQLTHRVQVFTEEGTFVREFGSNGKGEGELNHPVGIAVDSNGLVYISERGNDRISVFTSKGRFVKLFGAMNCPRGVRVDDCGVVYVCSKSDACVQFY